MAIGFLMTGGASRRMRRHKALLGWYAADCDGPEEASLAAHLCGVLRIACSDVFLVGDSDVAVHGSVRLGDAVTGAGPLGGLLRVLLYPRNEEPWRMVLSCDTPFVKPALLSQLLALAKASEAHRAEAAIPRTPDGQLHPLCAVYHHGLGSRLQALLDTGTGDAAGTKFGRGPSMHRFIGSIRAEILPIDDGSLLRNLNTMQEYLVALRDLRQNLRT